MLKIALVGAELEENLGLRYMTSALEREKHRVEIVPFNTEQDISQTVKQVIAFSPQVTGLSMVFTSRARVLSSGPGTQGRRLWRSHRGGRTLCFFQL